MKYKQIKSCILFLLVLGGLTGVQTQSLYILESTGTKTDFALTDIKTLTFSGGNLNVNKKDGSSISKLLTNIRYLNFSPYTGIFVPETQINGELLLYPSPAKDILTIDYRNDLVQGEVQIEVLTVDGRVMYAQSYNSLQNNHHLIDVSGWQRGLYLIRINNGTGTITKKMIKN